MSDRYSSLRISRNRRVILTVLLPSFFALLLIAGAIPFFYRRLRITTRPRLNQYPPNTTDGNENLCIICRDEVGNNSAVYGCQECVERRVHMACAARWFRRNTRLCCPFCRTPLDVTDIQVTSSDEDDDEDDESQV